MAEAAKSVTQNRPEEEEDRMACVPLKSEYTSSMSSSFSRSSVSLLAFFICFILRAAARRLAARQFQH